MSLAEAMWSFSLKCALCFRSHAVAIISVYFLDFALSCLKVFLNSAETCIPRHAWDCSVLVSRTVKYALYQHTQGCYCSLKSRTQSNAKLKVMFYYVTFWMWLLFGFYPLMMTNTPQYQSVPLFCGNVYFLQHRVNGSRPKNRTFLLVIKPFILHFCGLWVYLHIYSYKYCMWVLHLYISVPQWYICVTKSKASVCVFAYVIYRVKTSET